MFDINNNSLGTVLAIGAHPDDIELGCGATLSRHVAEGMHVMAVIMTPGLRGTSGEYNRLQETRLALAHLGIRSVLCLEHPDTRLGQQLDKLIASLEWVLTHKIPPDAPLQRVYTMHRSDRHQDHRAVFEASIVACRPVRQILSYETPSAWASFQPHIYSEITDQHMENKLRALQEHHSQQHRDYMHPAQICSVARFRGQQAGCELGEAFAVHKMVI